MSILKGLKGREREVTSEEAQLPVEEAETPKAESAMAKVGKVIKTIGIVLYRLRKIFMALPVLYGAFRLAFYNMASLPEQVGLNLQVNGEYAQFIDRNTAVFGPLGVTAACLLIMFISRKPLHPWVISIFTLVLPILLLVTNLYPR